jgi:hypothetical protein
VVCQNCLKTLYKCIQEWLVQYVFLGCLNRIETQKIWQFWWENADSPGTFLLFLGLAYFETKPCRDLFHDIFQHNPIRCVFICLCKESAFRSTRT